MSLTIPYRIDYINLQNTDDILTFFIIVAQRQGNTNAPQQLVMPHTFTTPRDLNHLQEQTGRTVCQNQPIQAAIRNTCKNQKTFQPYLKIILNDPTESHKDIWQIIKEQELEEQRS